MEGRKQMVSDGQKEQRDQQPGMVEGSSAIPKGVLVKYWADSMQNKTKQTKGDMEKSAMFMHKRCQNFYELESLFKICTVDTVQ